MAKAALRSPLAEEIPRIGGARRRRLDQEPGCVQTAGGMHNPRVASVAPDHAAAIMLIFIGRQTLAERFGDFSIWLVGPDGDLLKPLAFLRHESRKPAISPLRKSTSPAMRRQRKPLVSYPLNRQTYLSSPRIEKG
jgi:hypothetical protein